MSIDDGIFVFSCFSGLFFYLFIGAYVGYRHSQSFYGHCEGESESLVLLCFFLTILLWPLRFPFGLRRDENNGVGE